MADNPEWHIEFFTDYRKHTPVLDYLNGLPQAKKLKGKGLTLWELRPMPTRIFYFFHTGRRIILLHAFVKKKDRTDENEIRIALNRLKVFLEREDE